MSDYQAQQAARSCAASALQAAFPHMVPVGGKNHSRVAAAKNIRIELKALWPSVKFSVTGDSFSGGDAIRVRWEDGPIEAQVDAVVGKYEAGSFNGMEDIYEYSRSAWKDAFGDAKYISCSRGNSDKALASALRTLKSQNWVGAEELDLSLEGYKAGKLRNERICGEWVETMVHRVACRRIWVVAKKVAAPKMEEAAA
jgi:hypothetical protein